MCGLSWPFHGNRKWKRQVRRFQWAIRMFIIFARRATRRKLRKSDLSAEESRFGITFTFMKLEMRKVFLEPRKRVRSRSWRGLCPLAKYFRWQLEFSYPSYGAKWEHWRFAAGNNRSPTPARDNYISFRWSLSLIFISHVSHRTSCIKRDVCRCCRCVCAQVSILWRRYVGK